MVTYHGTRRARRVAWHELSRTTRRDTKPEHVGRQMSQPKMNARKLEEKQSASKRDREKVSEQTLYFNEQKRIQMNNTGKMADL